jgi:CheY-like chemotaxis protein
MKSRYIIFADDDADDLELITGFFKQYNKDVHVLTFRDGKEVIKFLGDFALNNSSPKLIVLDINMPRLNGKDTLVEIRKKPGFRNIPVVMYTTSSSGVDEEFCRQMGASWVTKSSSIDGVRQTAKILADFCRL